MARNFQDEINISEEEDGTIRLTFTRFEQYDYDDQEKIETMPLMPVSVAAALANMHPQTVRQYDRLGLVIPGRTKGQGRRYSLKNVERLLNIQRMSREGVNLEGIRRIIELEEEKEILLRKIEKLEIQVQANNRIFTADSKGRIHPMRRGMRYSIKEEAGDSCALVIWKPTEGF